jgi:hypothetical protein
MQPGYLQPDEASQALISILLELLSSSQHCESHATTEVGEPRTRNAAQCGSTNIELFMTLWLGLALLILFNGVLIGLLEDRGMFFAYLSGPLSWFDSAFIVRPDTRHIVMFGIFLTNTIVDTFFLFPLIVLFRTIFRTIFRRNRITRLGIDGTAKVEEDDDKN